MASPEIPKFEPKKELKTILGENKKPPETPEKTADALAQREKSRKALREFADAPGDKIERYKALSDAIKQISKEVKKTEDEVWKILFPELTKITGDNIDFVPTIALNYYVKIRSPREAMWIYKNNKGKEFDPLLLETLKEITEKFVKSGNVDFLNFCAGYMHIPFINKAFERLIREEVKRSGWYIMSDENLAILAKEPYAEELLLQMAEKEAGARNLLRNIIILNNEPYAKKILEKAVDTVNKKPEDLLSYTENLKNVPYAFEYIRNSAYKHIENGHPEAVLDVIPKLKNTAVLDMADMVELGKWVMMEEIIDKALSALSKIHPENLMKYHYFFEKSSRKKEYMKIGIEAMAAKSEDVLQYYYFYRDEPYASLILEKSAKARPGDVLKYYHDIQGPNESHKELIAKSLARCMTENPLEAMNYLKERIKVSEKYEIGLDKIEEKKEQSFAAAIEFLKNNNSVHDVEAINWELYNPVQKSRLLETAALGNLNIFNEIYETRLRQLEIPLSPKTRKLQKILELMQKEKIHPDTLLLMHRIVQEGMPVEEANNIAQYPDKLFKEVTKLSTIPNVLGKKYIEIWLSTNSSRHIYTINDLHEEKDEVRFNTLKDSSPEEIYSHMVYGEAEVFTSTFNGMYTRMMEKAKNEGKSGYQLLESVNFSHFRTFIKLCARYNRLKEFLGTMAADKQKEVVNRFVSSIESAQKPLEEAVTIADTFASIKDPELLRIIQEKIRNEFTRVQSKDNNEGKRLYGLLAGMFGKNANINQEWYKQMGEKYKLDDITHIDTKELYDIRNINTQQFFFYNDADGKSSFESFLNTYRGKPKWKIEDKKTYIIISGSENGRHVKMYANKPDQEAGTDDIEKAFKEKNIEKIVAVHRGHSYHASDTIRRLTSRAKIVVLGSCGGYTNVVGVLEKSPQAHILATKGTGTMTVNDPILFMLNEEILAGNNIDWQTFWDKAEKKLGDNPNFGSYVPPHRNLGIAFLKAYRTLTE